MTVNKYITASCVISDNAVYKNGQKLFENKNAPLSELLTTVYKDLGVRYPKFYKMDRLSKLGWICSEILLKSGFDAAKYQSVQVGIVLANTNSSLDNDIKYYCSVKDVPSPSLFVYTLPNIIIGEICIRNNFKGEHAFYLQEKFDAGFMEKQVNYLLDQDILQACICGWVDVLENNYKAVLFLIEKENTGLAMPFSKDEMDTVFNSQII